MSDVQRLCSGYRWQEDDNDDQGESEKERALRQWDARSLTWDQTSTGSTRVQLILPPEIAQAFLNSVEHSLNQLDNSQLDDSQQEVPKSKMSQRRADAAVLMAETSLQSAGREIATADRYQVIVSVEASELSSAGNINTPSKRPTVKAAGPIAHETAKRIACDCTLSIHQTENGEPVDIGRRSRIWPNAMARAIKERDQHCVWPGCTQTHHLHIHHIQHWADGGTTSVQNGVSLCSGHHHMVHEGGYTIERVDDHDQRLQEQFTQQQHLDDIGQFDFEKELRNDRKSFNTVRKLLPDCYRFRVLDAQGKDIRTGLNTDVSDCGTSATCEPDDSTRVYCGEPVQSYDYTLEDCGEHIQHCDHGKIRDKIIPTFTSEAVARYAVDFHMPDTVCH